MSEQYYNMILVAHSLMIQDDVFEWDDSTTVENFRNNETNQSACLKIFNWVLIRLNYELSWNQQANAINIYLNCKKGGKGWFTDRELETVE